MAVGTHAGDEADPATQNTEIVAEADFVYRPVEAPASPVHMPSRESQGDSPGGNGQETNSSRDAGFKKALPSPAAKTIRSIRNAKRASKSILGEATSGENAGAVVGGLLPAASQITTPGRRATVGSILRSLAYNLPENADEVRLWSFHPENIQQGKSGDVTEPAGKPRLMEPEDGSLTHNGGQIEVVVQPNTFSVAERALVTQALADEGVNFERMADMERVDRALITRTRCAKDSLTHETHVVKDNEEYHRKVVMEKDEVIQDLKRLLRTTGDELWYLREMSKRVIQDKQSRINELESALVKYSILCGDIVMPDTEDQQSAFVRAPSEHPASQPLLMGLCETLGALSLDEEVIAMAQGSSPLMKISSFTKTMSAAKQAADSGAAGGGMHAPAQDEKPKEYTTPHTWADESESGCAKQTSRFLSRESSSQDQVGRASPLFFVDGNKNKSKILDMDMKKDPGAASQDKFDSSGILRLQPRPRSVETTLTTAALKKSFMDVYAPVLSNEESNVSLKNEVKDKLLDMTKVCHPDLIGPDLKSKSVDGEETPNRRKLKLVLSTVGRMVGKSIDFVKRRDSREISSQENPKSEKRKRIWGGTLHAPIRDITGQCQIAKQHRHLQQQSMSSDNSMVFKALGGTEMFCDDDDDDEEHETEGLLARILSFFGLVQDEFRLDGGEDVVAETLVGQIFIYNWLAGVMLFTGFEIFTCLYLQVFYPYPDFTCKAATDSNGNPIVLVEPGGTGLLVTGLLMHFAELAASNLTQDNGFILLRCLCHFTTVFDAVKAVGAAKLLFNLVDVIVFISSAVVLYFNSQLCIKYQIPLTTTANALPFDYLLIRRAHVAIHVVRVVMCMHKCNGLGSHLKIRLQTVVSQNKRRFIDPDNNLNLDLTYICDRVIAMAIPCVNEAMYRNDIREVARFFATRHYGRFMIFNLCEDFEEGGNGNYDCMLLYDQVQKMPHRDHNVPPLSMLILWCEKATAWLNQDPANVAAVHCRGGKGRTGTFCCALMIWLGISETAESSMVKFANRRTDRSRILCRTLQGVAAPCQKRYLYYLEDIVYRGRDSVSPKRVLITNVRILTMPMRQKEWLRICMVIEDGDHNVIYDQMKEKGVQLLLRKNPPTDYFDFECPGGVLVSGDVCIRFFSFEEAPVWKSCLKTQIGRGGREMTVGGVTGHLLLFVSFHTSFHKPGILAFHKEEIDMFNTMPDMHVLPDFIIHVTLVNEVYSILPSSDVTQFGVDGRMIEQPQVEKSLQMMMDWLMTYETEPRSKSKCDDNDLVAAANGLFEGEISDAESEMSEGTMEKNILLKKTYIDVASINIRGVEVAINPSSRVLLLHDRILSIFMKHCPENTYLEREVIFNPGDVKSDCRELFLVTEGTAWWTSPDDPLHRVWRGDSMVGMTIGVGDTVNELGFTLGCEMENNRCILVAKNGICKCRVLSVPGDPCGIVAASLPGLDHGESAAIFEWLAKEQYEKARTIMARASRLSVNWNVKMHTKQTTMIASGDYGGHYADIIKRAYQKFNLPETQELLKMVNGHMILSGGATMNGSMLCFTNWILFVASPYVFSTAREADQQRRYLILNFKNIESAGVVDGVTTVVAAKADVESEGSESIPGGMGLMDIAKATFDTMFDIMSKKPKQRVMQRTSDWATMGTSGRHKTQGRDGADLHHYKFVVNDADDEVEMNKVLQERFSHTHRRYLGSNDDTSRSKLRKKKQITSQPNFFYLLADEIGDFADRKAVEQIFLQSMLVKFKHNEEIVKIGSNERKLYHIVTGHVTCRTANNQVLVKLCPGEIFGAVTCLDSGNRGAGASVWSEGDCECIVVLLNSIEYLSSIHRLVGARFGRSMAIISGFRLRKLQEIARDARQRLLGPLANNTVVGTVAEGIPSHQVHGALAAVVG